MAISALGAFAAAPAAQADTRYPTGGDTFNSGSDGWFDGVHSCTLLNLLPTSQPICEVRNTHNPSIGNPPGSLQTDFRTVANALGLLLNGVGTYVSPDFTVKGSPGISGAALRFDRRADVDALFDIGGTATFSADLVDVTNGGARTTVVSEALTDSNNIFERRVAQIGGAAFVPGHVYHLEFRTQFTTSLLEAALGLISVNYDNVLLQVADGTKTYVSVPDVTTDDATDITDNGTGATVNSDVNPEGLTTTVSYQYGVGALTSSTPAVSIGTGVTTVTPNPVKLTGLVPCTTYEFRAKATNSVGTANGATKTFTTACKPSVVTLAVSGISATTAFFNASINPNGPATSFIYEYGVTAGNLFTASSDILPVGSGFTPISPLTWPVSGLAPSTQYSVQAIGSNANGLTYGNIVTFTTTPLGGPTGAQGAQGSQGGQGAQGGAGDTGAAGVTGGPGLQGAAGSPGVQGLAGKPGKDLTTAKAIEDILSSSKRALVRIDGAQLKVPRGGRTPGRLRLQIFCRGIADRTCSGTIKVFTVSKINPASVGKRAARRVTFATAPFQLDKDKIGFAILNVNAQRRAVLKRIKHVEVSVIAATTDSGNARQNVRRTATLSLGK